MWKRRNAERADSWAKTRWTVLVSPWRSGRMVGTVAGPGVTVRPAVVGGVEVVVMAQRCSGRVAPTFHRPVTRAHRAPRPALV